MQRTDIAIVGGGMAGSTAAAMLGRRGIDTIVIDPHAVYPPDFRCEKLDGSQVALLRKTGLADVIFDVATQSDDLWIARNGRLVEKRRNDQVDALYDTMVNAMRGAIGGSASLIVDKVASIVPGPDDQTVTLAGGETIAARLVVLANGLNFALRRNLNLEREVTSPCHSISIGFDIEPVGRPTFDFRALTYYAERLSERISYLSMFPIGNATRANLFVYREMNDPWLRDLRHTPVEALLAAMPGLKQFTGEFTVPGQVHIRPVDLYVTTGTYQPGGVVVGDACGTSCPAAGTGLNKAFTDVERLVNQHIPRWLETPGMSADKIAAFYADPVKVACDTESTERAHYRRTASTSRTLAWRARRRTKYLAQRTVGTLREARARLSAGSSLSRPAVDTGP